MAGRVTDLQIHTVLQGKLSITQGAAANDQLGEEEVVEGIEPGRRHCSGLELVEGPGCLKLR